MQFTQKLTPVNHSTGRYLNGVAQVVTHIVVHTMVGYLQGTEDRFFNPASELSAHYGIGEDGSLKQWVNEADTAWQAGDWPMNTRSIGIEHEDKGDYNGVRTQELYTTAGRLVADICRRYNLAIDRSTIRLHKEVDTMPGGTACPDALDVNRIIAEAQTVMGDKVAATAPAAAAHADFSVAAIDETVQITLPVLDVRTGPGTSFPGRQANSPDGYAHQTADVHVIGYVVGEDPYNDGRNIWLKTLNGLGQSHYIWAGGTNFVMPQQVSPSVVPPVIVAPDIVPIPVNIVAPAPITPIAPEPVVIPPSSIPVTGPPQPVVQPLQASTVQAPNITRLNPPAQVALSQAAMVTDLITGDDVEVVPHISPSTGEPTILTVAGVSTTHGVSYLVTQKMIDEGLPHGINQIFINPPTANKVDSLSKVKVQIPVHSYPAGISHGWRSILRFLHLIH